MKSHATSLAPDLFIVETDGEVTSLRFLQRELAGVDLRRMQALWRFLRQQEDHPSKVLVLEAPSGLLSPQSIDDLLSRSGKGDTGDQKGPRHPGRGLWQAFEDLRREENSQIQMIERIISLDCFVIAVIQGEIDLALLGPVLCCDYQIASDDTVIVNRVLEGGLLSTGGMMWILTRRLGLGAARGLLWSGKDLSSADALSLGLLNEVAPKLELQSRAQKASRWFASKPRQRLPATKALLNAADLDLDSYLRNEQLELNRTLGAIMGSP